MMRRDLLRWEAQLIPWQPPREIDRRCLASIIARLEGTRESGVMGRQRAEESLNSFNAAPPLSDARLSSRRRQSRSGRFPVSRK